MTLPEIPNAAAMAGMRVAPAVDENDVDRILEFAWPRLYAAALRHAAETLFQPEPSVPAAILRQAADEAAGGWSHVHEWETVTIDGPAGGLNVEACMIPGCTLMEPR